MCSSHYILFKILHLELGALPLPSHSSGWNILKMWGSDSRRTVDDTKVARGDYCRNDTFLSCDKTELILSNPHLLQQQGGKQRKDKAQGGKRAINPNQSCCFFILFFFPVPSLFLPLLLLLCCISICTSVPQLGNTFPNHPLPFFALFPPCFLRSNQNRTLSFLVKMSHPSPRILFPPFI